MKTPLLGKKEKIWLLLGSALVVFLGYLPNLFGWLNQTPEMRFNGAAIDWMDIAVHLATIRMGMLGNWRYTLFFTAIPQEGHYIKLFYIALGQFFRLFSVSPITAYTIGLLFFQWLSSLFVYRFIAEFFQKPKYRVTAFLLAIFSAGIGWLLLNAGVTLPGGYTPADLWDIDPYPLISMGVFPHFGAVVAGQLGFVLLFLRYRETPRPVYLIGMAGIGILLQAINSIQPMLPFLIVWGVILGDWITKKRFPKDLMLAYGVVGIVQLPVLGYNFWVFLTDPIWRSFAGQLNTLSLPPIYYFFGFFWLWLLCLPVFLKPKLFADPEGIDIPKRIAILTWVVGAMVLAYIPWPMQRRFLLYYTLPLAILAVIGFQEIVSPWMNKNSPFLAQRKTLLLILLLFVVSFSHIYRYVSLATEFSTGDTTLYHPAEVGEALAWLEDETWAGSVMLGAEETGLLAAAYAYQPSYVAHEFESIDYDNRIEQVEQFYQNEIGLADLDADQIDWIFYGPYERELGPDFAPPAGYQAVYQQDGVIIYQWLGEAE